MVSSVRTTFLACASCFAKDWAGKKKSRMGCNRKNPLFPSPPYVAVQQCACRRSTFKGKEKVSFSDCLRKKITAISPCLCFFLSISIYNPPAWYKLYIYLFALPHCPIVAPIKGWKEEIAFSILAIIFHKSQLLLQRSALASKHFTKHRLYTSKDKNVFTLKWPCVALKFLRMFGYTGD